MRKPSQRLLALASLALLLPFAACSRESKSPTEPVIAISASADEATSEASAGPSGGGTISADQPLGGGGRIGEGAIERASLAAESVASEVTGASPGTAGPTLAARGGNPTGNGNGGNGNGNGGNGGGRPPGAGALHLDMQPATWNLNWERSSGTVSALVRGTDARRIDAGSVELVGNDGVISPRRVQQAGGQLRAFFGMADALDILDDPDTGEVHEVTLRFTIEGEPGSLIARVRIVGRPGDDDGDDDELDFHAVLQPAAWNVNWERSAGTFSVLLRGDVDEVDLDSLELVGAGGTLEPLRAPRLTGNHVRAFFAKADAMDLLDDPDAGERHEVTLRFLDQDGATHELVLRLRVVGPGAAADESAEH